VGGKEQHGGDASLLTRRRFLCLGAASVAVLACGSDDESPRRSPIAPVRSPAPDGTPRGALPPTGDLPMTRRLYRDGALADGRSDRLEQGVSILVENGRIRWIRSADDEGPLDGEPEVIDASGSVIVPGLVDAHSHVTLPGGARWIDRANDSPEALLAAAERNARLLTSTGVRWARDVGSPRMADPLDGRTRALALGVRDRWRDRPGLPHIRAAGTWLTRSGSLPAGLAIEVDNADELLDAAIDQLDEGADLVKLYLDGPDLARSPWSVEEVQRVVTAVHERGARITAHSGRIDGARVGATAGIDALEHGFELDESVAQTMADKGVTLVSTLTVLRSWLVFSRTTTIDRFAGAGGRARIEERLEAAEASVRIAHRRGVAIASGNRSWPRASSPGRRWAPRPGGAVSCSESLVREPSTRAAPRTSSWSTAIR
jgi:imidazolonepropionase-like amidohydrolase